MLTDWLTSTNRHHQFIVMKPDQMLVPAAQPIELL